MLTKAYMQVGAGQLSGDDVENILFSVRYKIVGVHYSLALNSIVDNTKTTIQLSTLPIFQSGSVIAGPVIIAWELYNNFVTSGMANSTLSGFCPLEEEISPGQSVYINASGGGTGDFLASIILYMRGGNGK